MRFDYEVRELVPSGFGESSFTGGRIYYTQVGNARWLNFTEVAI